MFLKFIFHCSKSMTTHEMMNRNLNQRKIFATKITKIQLLENAEAYSLNILNRAGTGPKTSSLELGRVLGFELRSGSGFDKLKIWAYFGD